MPFASIPCCTLPKPGTRAAHAARLNPIVVVFLRHRTRHVTARHQVPQDRRTKSFVTWGKTQIVRVAWLSSADEGAAERFAFGQIDMRSAGDSAPKGQRSR